MSNKILTDTGAVCLTSPNNELNGSPVGSAQLACPNSCHDFCGKLGNMQEQKSRQQLGQTSSFSSNALGEISLGPGFHLGQKNLAHQTAFLLLEKRNI
jgi:hypothetical protein